MSAVFMLSERGTSFATRTRAAEIVNELAGVIDAKSAKEITVDLKGVSVVSPSFTVAFINSLRLLLARNEYRADIVNIVCDNPLVRDRFKKAFQQNMAFIQKSQSLNRVLIG